MSRLLPALLLMIGTGLAVAQPAATQPAAGQPATAPPAAAQQPVTTPPRAFNTRALAVAEPAAEGKAIPRVLGRVKPPKAFDYGHYRAVQGTDGQTRYFPRLAKNADVGKLTVALPAAVDWSSKAHNVVRRMYLNDQLGCCVFSSRYHQLGFMTGADTGTGLEAKDSEIADAYRRACGPGDNGCNMSVVNQYQQQVGLSVNGKIHKTSGSVSIDHTNKELIKAGIYFFGGVNVGLSLPNSWYESADGTTWDFTNTQIVGGHEVQAFGYNDKGVLISTWGGTRTITWAAFTSDRYIDETYVTLSPDWVGSDSLAPNGVDVATLEKDLALIAGGTVPVLPDPGPGPGPGPIPTGKGFTGTLQYRDGVLLSVTPGTPQAAGVEADLKAVGINAVVIADVLKLIADVRGRASLRTITTDLFTLLRHLEDAERNAPAPAQNADAPQCCGGSEPARR